MTFSWYGKTGYPDYGPIVPIVEPSCYNENIT